MHHSTQLLLNERKNVSFDLKHIRSLLWGGDETYEFVKTYYAELDKYPEQFNLIDFYNWGRKE